GTLLPSLVLSSPCRRMKAFCPSVNLDLFMVLPRPTARIAHAAKLEFSSKDRSENREAGHGRCASVAGEAGRRSAAGHAANTGLFDLPTVLVTNCAIEALNDPQPEGHMASHIERRKFLATLGGVAAAWPLAARAQRPDRVRRIGVLMSYAADDPAGQARLLAFAQELAPSGWIHGRNVRIDVRW